VINSAKEILSQLPFSSPFTKTFISHKKAQKHKKANLLLCAFVPFVANRWVDDAAELGGLIFRHRAMSTAARPELNCGMSV
jgi:hypothetical protein